MCETFILQEKRRMWMANVKILFIVLLNVCITHL